MRKKERKCESFSLRKWGKTRKSFIAPRCGSVWRPSKQDISMSTTRAKHCPASGHQLHCDYCLIIEHAKTCVGDDGGGGRWIMNKRRETSLVSPAWWNYSNVRADFRFDSRFVLLNNWKSAANTSIWKCTRNGRRQWTMIFQWVAFRRAAFPIAFFPR